MNKKPFLGHDNKSIMFLGRTPSGQEIWLNKEQITTHMFLAGSTGSGKTEFLLNMLTNTMLWGSGAVVIDGKGDISFFSKLHAIATATGRAQDLLLLNFSMANVENGEQVTSHTCNPFAILSADELDQIMTAMISNVSSHDSMWRERAIGLMTSVIQALVWLRDHNSEPLTISKISQAMPLQNYRRLLDRLEKIEGVKPSVIADMRYYLDTLPGYRNHADDPSGTADSQHGYLTMQWTRPLTLLKSGYGHILDVEHPDIDIKDVVLNRRILMIMLPSLEKSGSDVANVGNLMVGMIKSMMGQALRTPVEGGWGEVVTNRLTNADYPFMLLMDEVGQYPTAGMDMMAQQARSLNFGLVFSTQDFDSFHYANPKLAAAILANTNTKVLMKAEYPNSPVAQSIIGYFDNQIQSRLLKNVNLALSKKVQVTDRINYISGTNRGAAERRLEELNKSLLLNNERLTRDTLTGYLKAFKPGEMLVTHGNHFLIGRSGFVDVVIDQREYQIGLQKFSHIDGYDVVERDREKIEKLRDSLLHEACELLDEADQSQISRAWLCHSENADLVDPQNLPLWSNRRLELQHHIRNFNERPFRYVLLGMMERLIGISDDEYLEAEFLNQPTRSVARLAGAAELRKIVHAEAPASYYELLRHNRNQEEDQ